MLWEKSFDHTNADEACAHLVAAWEDNDNKVFVLRNNGKIDDVKKFFTQEFDHLGTAVPLAEDVNIGDRSNQRSGEIWMEVRYDPKHPDAYRHSSNAQPLHTDGSYIPDFPNATLMVCVANAGEGGETTFISASDVVASLELENPELLQKLSEHPVKHRRSGDERSEKIIDISCRPFEVNWNYYCLSSDITPNERSIAESFFGYLKTSPLIAAKTLAVKLRPGDAVTWKDRELLHGRNGFIATAESERFIWKCAIDIGRFG